MKFDYIIANPPYGKNSVLGRKIINIIYKEAKQCICLATVTAYKNTNYNAIQQFKELKENPFKDVSFTGGLAIAYLIDGKIGPFKSYEDIIYLNKPFYIKTYLKYQQEHPRTYKLIRSTFSTWHWTDNQVNCFSKKHPRDKIFVQTHWNVHDGVHLDENAFDRAFNLHNAPFYKKTDCWFLEFKTTTEAENIKKWYYSKGKNGLANFIYKNIVGAVHYFPADVLPNLDWSHPWTDEEILEEIGLPKDFLDKKEY